MTIVREPVVSAPSRHEAAWFVAAASAFVFAELASLRAWHLISRPFWLDEVHTYLLAGTQSPLESIRSLAAGADFNPPTVFLLYRAAGFLAGGVSETTTRVVALACVVGALTTVYLLLRDQFLPRHSVVGAAAVWAQQVVMHAAFEARFYGPWLFASGCLLLAVLRAVRGLQTRASGVWLALASIIVCTVHYFGVLSWAIAISCAVVSIRDSRPAMIRRLLPALAGPAALGACVPLYVGQRAALSVPTWIPHVSVGDATFLLAVFLLPLPTLIAAACWGVGQAMSRRSRTRIESRSGRTFTLGPWLLLTQAAVPLVLVLFSLLVQPATQPRYWIDGALATAPVVALLISSGDALVAGVGSVAILITSVNTLRGERDQAEGHTRRVREDVRIVSSLSSAGDLVVARRRDTLYPVLYKRPDLRANVAILDATSFDTTNAFAAVERDVTRVHQRLYGFPRLVTPADLAGIRSFYIVELGSRDAPTAKQFPRRSISRVADRVFRVSLTPPADP